MEPLRQYLTQNRIKQAAFARDLEMSRGFLGDLLAGRRTPGLALAKKIDDATQGAVPMSVWLERSHIAKGAGTPGSIQVPQKDRSVA